MKAGGHQSRYGCGGIETPPFPEGNQSPVVQIVSSSCCGPQDSERQIPHTAVNCKLLIVLRQNMRKDMASVLLLQRVDWNKTQCSEVARSRCNERMKIKFARQRSVQTNNTKVKVKVNVKLSLCLAKHHAMKTYWGSGCIAPVKIRLRGLNGRTHQYCAFILCISTQATHKKQFASASM